MKQILLITALLFVLQISFAQKPGDLYQDFGDGGKVLTQFADGSAGITSGALQKDGKMISAGGFNFYGDENFITYPMLIRYNADGSVDTSFGIKGRSLSLDNRVSYATINSIVTLDDGKILATGEAQKIANFDLIVIRYNPDGKVDSTFGVNGWSIIELGENEFGHAVSIQNDGKIAVSGSWFNRNINIGTKQFLTARFLADGKPDDSFGNNGTVLTPFDVPFDEANAVAIQDDGKIIAAGYTTHTPPVPGKYTYFALCRYQVNGELDSSFGTNGKVITDFGANGEVINSIIIQSDGKIVAAGYSNLGINSNEYVALARYNTDGSLDNTFGNEGKVITPIIKTYSHANSVIIQKNNKILIGGFTVLSTSELKDFLLLRYNTDGNIDSGFGTNGQVITDFGYSDYIASVAIDNNGKITAIGQTADVITPFGFYGVALAQYYGDPVRQPSPIAKKIRRWIRNHTLQWQPLNDDDIAYYSIQQSSNGVNGFKEIARISQNSKVKSKNEEAVYSYSLTAASSNIQNSTPNTNYYRITAVSSSGSNVTSDAIADESVSSITLSPNPVKDVMKIAGLPAGVKSTINIVNRDGNVLQSAICNASIYNLNIAQLKSGLYSVQVVSNGNTQTLKFIKE